jgi:hypothetical protein
MSVDGTNLWLSCPACDTLVRLSTVLWDWDGDTTAPTVTPSICTVGVDPASGVPTRCHAFLTDGVWRYLDDSTHHLAGGSAPVAPLPHWFTTTP